MENTNNNIINANLGITNIVEKDEIRNTMVKTFIELADKLKAHCGPYSGTAILTNPSDALAEPIFTKDGINIIRSMKYAAPIQDFVRMQLAYMGSRVERSAGDGTTSTMIIMAYTLAALLEYMDKSKFIYSTNDIASTWRDLVVAVTDEYKKRAESALDYLKKGKEYVEYIAASQAYTSSHGDMELAKCIGTLFCNTPREVWDTLTANKAIYESEEKYTVTVNKSQYALENVKLFPKDKCNEDLGTSLRWNDVDCMIQPSIAIGDQYQEELHKTLQAKIESGDRLIVITSDDMDGATISHYQELFSNNPKHQVIFVQVPVLDANLNDLNAVSVLRYEAVVDQEQQDKTFKADVYYTGNTFRFVNGLIIEKETREGVNPYYKSEKHPAFNEFIDALKTIIEREKADVSRSNARVIQSFIRILHKLVATKDVVFTVGGAAYDNAAAQDVALDALLATKCSLTKGFVAGRFVTLKAVLTELKSPQFVTRDTKPLKLKELESAFIDALLSGIDEVDHALADSVGISENIEKALEYRYAPVDFTRLDDPFYEIPTSLDEAIMSRKDYCILEPIETDITFIKRFGEIGLKFLTANRVIANGYLYDGKNKK